MPGGYADPAAVTAGVAGRVKEPGRFEVGFVESGFALASKGSARVLTGRYRLDGLIGSGGAADVHRGSICGCGGQWP